MLSFCLVTLNDKSSTLRIQMFHFQYPTCCVIYTEKQDLLALEYY